MIRTRLFLLVTLVGTGLVVLLLYHSRKQVLVHPRIQNNHLVWGVASHVFIISLQRRADRRASLSPLLNAFGFVKHTNLTSISSYSMATDASDPRIARIEQHVRWQRRKERQTILSNISKPNIGSFEDSWSHGLDVAWGSDYWGRTPLRDDAKDERYLPLPDLLDPDSDHTLLVEKGNPFNPHKHISNATLPVSLTRAMIACWYSHATLIRDIALKTRDGDGNQTFIILEDDIDFEWDIEERLVTLWKALPANWELVMLGHCWSDERRYPPLVITRLDGRKTSLHRSNSPLCTHAYALSGRGATRLAHLLRHPSFAYSRALDQAFAWLIRTRILSGAYSVVPPLVVQTKEGKSDIYTQRRKGSRWKDSLGDGARSRIRQW